MIFHSHWYSFYFIFMFLHFQLFQGEGVAYRGRVLVQLSTQLDGKTDKNVDDISSDDILVAQVLTPLTVTLSCCIYSSKLQGAFKLMV